MSCRMRPISNIQEYSEFQKYSDTNAHLIPTFYIFINSAENK